jgi:ABC-type glycerol-3-phosphate transport system substrate-binding protein
MTDTSAEALLASTAVLEAPTLTSATDADRLKPSKSAEERLEVWHRHASENQEQIHEEMVRAREVLHMGTAADAVALANEDIDERAIAAARRWQSV